MNKTLKPAKKELEELKNKLNDKYVQQIEKMLLKFNII